MKTVKKILSDIKRVYETDSMGAWVNTTELIRKINGISLHYAYRLGYTQQEVLNALEKERTYNINNYYINLRRIDDDVIVIEDKDEFNKMFPSGKFNCPSCKKIIDHPTKCPKCDWKSYGLFGTLGNGYRFLIRKDFLEVTTIHNIFKPIEIK